MTAITNLRFAVLTDFHAYASRPEDKAPPPSWLDLTKSQTDPTLNPFAGLLAAIGCDDSMRADLLLCCGDMGDKANPAGQQ